MRILFIIFLSFAFQSYAQQTNDPQSRILSAEKKLEKIKRTKADSVFIDSLISFSKQFLYKDLNYSNSKINIAIAWTDSIYGKKNLRYLEALHQYAILLSINKQYNDSYSYNEMILEERMKILSNDHLDVLKSKNNLALNLLDLKDFEKYETLMTEVISDLKNSKNFEPIFTRTAFYNYANYYWNLKNYDNSIALLIELCTIEKSHSDHEETAITLQKLADNYLQLAQYKLAYSSCIESLDICNKNKIKNDQLKKYQLKSLVLSMFNLNMINEVEKPLHNLELLAKKSWDDQVWAKYYTVLHCSLMDNSECFEKELKYLENLYIEKYPNEIDALGELYWSLSNSLDNYKAYKYALKTSKKLFDLYKEMATNDIRFFNSGFALGTSLQNTERFKEAIETFEDVKQKSNLAIEQNENYFLLLGNLARCYKTIGNSEKSISTRQEAIESFKRLEFIYLKNPNSELDKLIAEQTSELLMLGKIEDLENFYNEIIDFYSTKRATLSQIENLIKLSKIFSEKLYNPEKARIYLDNADLLISDKDEITIQNGKLNHAKGNFYRLQNKFSSNFIYYYQKAYDILRQLEYIGSGNFEFGSAAFNLTLHQINLNNIEEAKKIYSELTILQCDKFGEDSYRCFEAKLNELNLFKDHIPLDTLKVKINKAEDKNQTLLEDADLKLKLNGLKYYLEKDGSLEQKKIIQEDISLMSKSYNNDSKSVLIKTQKLAQWYFDNDSIDKGLDVWKTILKSVDSLDSDDLYFTMYSIYASQLILRNINVDFGVKILEEDLKIEERKIFAEYDDLIIGLKLKGQFSHAIKLIEEKEDFLIKKFGENSDEYLNFGNIRLNYYEDQGDYLNLIKCGEKFLNICEKLYPENLSKQINYIHPLCTGYINLQNSERVIDLTNRKLKHFNLDLTQMDINRMSMEQINNYFILNFLNTFSAFYESMYNVNVKNQLSEAKLLLQKLNKLKTIARVIDIKEMDPIIDVISIGIKATIQDSISKNDLKLFKESIDFLVKLETRESKELVYRVLNITDLMDSIIQRYNLELPPNYHERMGNFKKADSLAFLDIKTTISKMNRYKYTLSEEQQLFSKNIISNILNYDLLSFVEKIHFQDSTSEFKLTSNIESNHRTTEISGRDIYELLFNTTGSMLQNWKQLNEKLNQRLDLIELKNKWVNLQNEISNDAITPERKIQLKDSIMLIEQKLFQELGAPEYQWLRFDELQSKLAPNEVLIHSIRLCGLNHEKNLIQDSVIYLHFLIYGEAKEMRIIATKMNPEQEKEFSENYMYYTSGKGRSIPDAQSYFSLFPFLHEIKEGKKIIYVPDGLYHTINPSSIFNPITGKYLLSSNQIEIVNYPSKLLNLRENSTKPKSAVLIGYPDFNSITSYNTPEQLIRNESPNSNRFDSLSRDGFSLTPLPNTKKEVDRINKILETNDWETVCYSTQNATEENLKSVKSPGILHIATHGYFLEDVPIESSVDSYLGMNRNRISEDPMLRSGLLLAGANNSLKEVDKSENNGIFSAFEASLLNLDNTELVVLSACETGRGEVKNGEGVYGLRKAFADAGAQNIIMSLWKVDDKVTQEFMTTFYSNWLNDKSTIREAFNKTQLEIKAKYPQPYYWGAFILVGE